MFGSSLKETKDAKPLHFFRIILGHDQKLGLPKRFVSAYGNDLSNSVQLAAPSGQVWQVELIKCDGEVWLGNGWKDFADYFSLKRGNLLVFRYEGHSRFHVPMIFDQTTFEIEYPFNVDSSKDANHDKQHQMPKVEAIESDVSVEIIHNISQCQKRPFPQPSTGLSSGIQGTVNVKQSGGTNGESNFQISSKISLPPAKQARQGTSAVQRSRPSNKAPREKRPLTAKRKTEALRASNFKSGSPFFVVVMYPSYLTGHSMHIPIAFARTYFAQNKDDVVLQDLDGKTWKVHFHVYEKNSCAHFRHGWKEFAIDHNLKVGDSCAFELLEGPEISLRVTIFRVTEDENDDLTAAHGSNESDYSSEVEVIASCPTTKEYHVPRRKFKNKHRKFKQVMQNETAGRVISRLSSKGAARALEKASKFRSNYPVFKVVIKEGFLQDGYPIVPESFCKEYIKRIPLDVTLKVKEKSWPIRLRLSNRFEKAAKFGAGWRAFAAENKLQVGNVCVFEMIKRKNIVLEVSIFRDGRSLG
ncbi:hypothetical protein PTKIN_Ptkin01aG0292100 [Pterospermum kingtungense]